MRYIVMINIVRYQKRKVTSRSVFMQTIRRQVFTWDYVREMRDIDH